MFGLMQDYEVIEDEAVSPELASAWGAPATAGARCIVMRPASGRDIFLRFVAGDPPSDYRPLRTYGWAAIEICVQDVLAVNERMKTSPFEIIGPPRELDGLPAIFPMQVKGPDDEIVYLTQIRNDLPAYDLPRAHSLIDCLFILVLACSDMRASNAWFTQVLKLSAGREMDITYTMLSQSFATPPEQKFTISTLIHERDVFLETDQYPIAATPRPSRPGALAPGVALCTLIHPDFDSVCGDWITPPAVREGAIYAGKRAGVLRAPDGVLVEVVEA
jgi:catechol 2,3-dioxygenase-like lactoylglutathione lyase family enzyme